jgi:hypothetical protein
MQRNNFFLKIGCPYSILDIFFVHFRFSENTFGNFFKEKYILFFFLLKENNKINNKKLKTFIKCNYITKYIRMSQLTESEINQLCIIEEEIISLRVKVKQFNNNINEIEKTLELNKIKDTHIDIEYYNSIINKNKILDFEKIDKERKSILKREQFQNEILELIKSIKISI